MLEVVEPCLLHALQVFARMGLGIIFAPREYKCYGDKKNYLIRKAINRSEGG